MDKFKIREYMRRYSNYKNNYNYKDIETIQNEEFKERKQIELKSRSFEYKISCNIYRNIIKNKAIVITDPSKAKLTFNTDKYLSFLTDIINLTLSNKDSNIKYKKVIKSKIINPLQNIEELIPYLKMKMHNSVESLF